MAVAQKAIRFKYDEYYFSNNIGRFEPILKYFAY